MSPVVVCDIDGTLADYHQAFASFAKRYHGMDNDTEGWNGYGEMEDWLGLSKQEYREAKLAYRQGGNKRWSSLLPGVHQFLETVQSEGARLWLATTRPWQRLDNIDPDTRWWLARHGILYEGLIYGEDKYEQLLEAVDRARILLVVDDLSEQLNVAETYGLATFQVLRHHNSYPDAQWHTRGTFNKANQTVTRLAELWRETHGLN